MGLRLPTGSRRVEMYLGEMCLPERPKEINRKETNLVMSKPVVTKKQWKSLSAFARNLEKATRALGADPGVLYEDENQGYITIAIEGVMVVITSDRVPRPILDADYTCELHTKSLRGVYSKWAFCGEETAHFFNYADSDNVRKCAQILFKSLLSYRESNELSNNVYVDEVSWQKFRDMGMLWWTNRILHLFGYALIVEVDKNNKAIRVYPARCKFRGFTEELETAGFKKLTTALNELMPELLKDITDKQV